jgi:AsmA family protein
MQHRREPITRKGFEPPMADRDAPLPVSAPAPARSIGTPLAATIAVATTLIGLMVLAWAVLFVTKGRFLKAPFEAIASAQTHRTVSVAGDFQLYFAPFSLKFVAEGLSIANPDWAGTTPFFSARRVEARIATLSLLGSRKRFRWLGLSDGRIDLRWDRGGRRNSWTFGSGGGEPLAMPLIQRARITGTQIRYLDPRHRLDAAIRVDTVAAEDNRFADTIHFDGNGTARGARFTLAGALLSSNQTLAGGENRLRLHAEGVRSRVDIAGTLPGATMLDGAKLHMDLRGQNLADVFLLAGIAVPDTRAYRLTSAVTKRGDTWRFTGMKGRFGDSDLAGKFEVTLGEPRLLVTAELFTHVLDIVDAGPFIGYDPNRLAAEGAAGAVTQVAGTPRLLPDAPLRVDALGNFDAKLHWQVRTLRAPDLPVSNIELTLDLDDRLLTLSPLNFSLARGTVTADIAIDARRSPVFTDYDIRLSPTPMGVLLAGFGADQSGTSGTLKARIKLSGSGNSVHDSLANADGRIAVIMPKGEFWTRNTELAEFDIGTFVQKMFERRLKEPVQINCGLIGFTVRGGVAAADPILIDTQKNVMVGRGGFSFRNESVDLAFRADSKRFSLFSAQSPVAIGGYFARPAIDVISPELLARVGGGLGLGLVATPLAGVIAFVDFGDAKAADCGPVLSGASAAAQRDAKGASRDDVGRGTTAKAESGKTSPGEAKKQRKKFLGIF